MYIVRRHYVPIQSEAGVRERRAGGRISPPFACVRVYYITLPYVLPLRGGARRKKVGR